MSIMLQTTCVLLLMVLYTQADDSCPGLPTCFCNKDKTSVNCEGKQFSEVPDTIPTTVEKLYLRHNKITTIRHNAFASLTRLQSIWLDKNLIDTIEPLAFNNLTNLKYLNMNSNKLNTLGPHALSGMPNLESIYLMTNKIQVVNETALVGAKALKSLYMQSNRLPTVPDLGFLPALEKLALEGNSIQNATFPDSHRNNTRLSYIVLSNNRIQSIDNDTFRALTNHTISSLFISRTGLTHTSTGVFSHFKSIASLKIGSNPLGPAALKMAIESLHGKDMLALDLSDLQSLHGGLLADTFALLKNTSITTLTMRNVYISSLPDDVFLGLNKLLHLDLSSCKLQTTSNDSFAGLDKLTILNLQKNKLTSVPCCLPGTLQKLFIDNNQIIEIGKNALYKLGRLSELRMSFNKILTLMQDSFNGLSSLEILDLYGNQIATLPGKVFAPLIRLKSLTLAKNNLAMIQQSSGHFSSLSSLVYFNMADNHCSYVQPDFFSQLNSLMYLRLDGNNLGNIIEQDYGGELLGNLKNLRELQLTNNRISSFSTAAFKSLSELVMLNISANKITTWDEKLFISTSNLRVLDLTNNLVGTVQEETLKHLPLSLVSVNLTGNPFMCDCNLRDFRDWINTTHTTITNNASYLCAGPKEWRGRPLLSFDRKKINCLFFTWWEITLACAVAVILILIISSVVYRKRWHIKLFFYKRRRSARNKKARAADGRGNYGAIDGDRPTFDAYISHSPEDSDWVKQNLLPGIDKGENNEKDGTYGGDFALYFEERDWLHAGMCCYTYVVSRMFNPHMTERCC